jgi:hypothetical protein
MPEFVAETCAPRDVPGAPMERAADIALAAGRASQRGGAVRFLGVILVPGEETCLWRYQAPSAGVVRLAMIRAGLRPGRITVAVPAGPAPRCQQADTNRVGQAADLRGAVRQAGRSRSISAGYSDRKGD